jgi:hypothetical protein
MAQDMKALFSSMPDSFIPQLETAWRKDLADLYQTGKEAKLKNIMNGDSELLELTADYLMLQVSPSSYVELKMLPLINNTYIICMIRTVAGPAPDSRVAFYTTEWQPLESSALLTPCETNWFIKEEADKESDAYLDAVSRLDIDLVGYRLSADKPIIAAVYTTPSYLGEEERKRLKPFLKDQPRIYTWNKSSFIPNP